MVLNSFGHFHLFFFVTEFCLQIFIVVPATNSNYLNHSIFGLPPLHHPHFVDCKLFKCFRIWREKEAHSDNETSQFGPSVQWQGVLAYECSQAGDHCCVWPVINFHCAPLTITLYHVHTQPLTITLYLAWCPLITTLYLVNVNTLYTPDTTGYQSTVSCYHKYIMI